VEDQSGTDLLALLAQVQAFAVANGLTAATVATRLLSLVTNNAPADAGENDAGATRNTAATRQQREEQRRKNQRLAAEMDAALQRPGSNQPLVTLAEQITAVNAIRADVAAALDSTSLPQAEKAAILEIRTARHVHQVGSNTVEAFLWQEEAKNSFF